MHTFKDDVVGYVRMTGNRVVPFVAAVVFLAAFGWFFWRGVAGRFSAKPQEPVDSGVGVPGVQWPLEVQRRAGMVAAEGRPITRFPVTVHGSSKLGEVGQPVVIGDSKEMRQAVGQVSIALGMPATASADSSATSGTTGVVLLGDTYAIAPIETCVRCGRTLRWRDYAVAVETCKTCGGSLVFGNLTVGGAETGGREVFHGCVGCLIELLEDYNKMKAPKR